MTKTLNTFYSAKEKNDLKDQFDLDMLAEEMHYMSYGFADTMRSLYRPTTANDYDEYFSDKLIKLDPPYLCEDFLNYHLKNYIEDKKGNKVTFIKHIKYVIKPIVEKRERKVFLELIDEWLETVTRKDTKEEEGDIE